MKYTTEVTIDKPLNEVIALFDNPDNLIKWQKGFVRIEHLSGNRGEAGSTSKLLYNSGGRKIELIETLVERNLPEKFSAIYEAKGMWNKHDNYFEAVDEHTTVWRTETEFTASTFSLKFLIKLFPGLFRKQTKQMMTDFKKFAEEYED